MIMLSGLLFTIVLICFLGLLTGGSPAIFIDTPSLIIILIPSIFFLFATKMGKSIINYFSCSFKKDYQFSKGELETLSYDLGALIKLIMASGFFGFIAGLIAMLFTLDDPSNIGPNVAVSLLTQFYAVAISFFIIYPTKVWAERKAKR